MNTYTKDINTIEDLININNLKNINLHIRSKSICKLNNIYIINGSLGIINSNINSLGDLNEIHGDFFISGDSNLKTLENLEIIKGDAILRYSNIEDLGALRVVEGKLSLRDTRIKDLGKLEYIGGDLFLPKRLENNVNLENIEVIGKIKYWNDIKEKAPEKKALENLGYSNEIVNVPVWEHKYIFSYDELHNSTLRQKEFYKIFKNNFFKNRYIDLKGNHNYSFILLFDLLKTYNNNDTKLKTTLETLGHYYPKTKSYVNNELIKIFEKNNDYESAWNMNLKNNYISIENLLKYESLLNRELINTDIILSLAGYKHLTNFGVNNIDSIKPFIKEQYFIYKSNFNKRFLEQFFDKDLPIKTEIKVKDNNKKSIFSIFKKTEYKVIKEYNPEYYKDFFLSISEYEHYKSIDELQTSTRYKQEIPHVVKRAVINQLKLIVKQTEDLYREKIGMPKVGEGWISETELFYKISTYFKNEKVIHHSSPIWLGRQHLDIYFPELNIAIEYQGEQHYKAIDFFGGEEALKKTIERDKRKKLLCERNNCFLIYVYKNYDFKELINKIITNKNYTTNRK